MLFKYDLYKLKLSKYQQNYFMFQILSHKVIIETFRQIDSNTGFLDLRNLS